MVTATSGLGAAWGPTQLGQAGHQMGGHTVSVYEKQGRGVASSSERSSAMVFLGERVRLEALVAWRNFGDFRGRGELSIAWRDIIGGTQVPPAFSGSLARPGPGLFMFRLRCEGSRQELSV